MSVISEDTKMKETMTIARLSLSIAVLVGAACAITPTPTATGGDTVQPPLPGEEDGTCEPVSAQLCLSVDRLNAYFPNLRRQSQTEASEEMTDFIQLFETACSGAVLHFFCSYYFPFCDPIHQLVLLPCKNFCELVRESCEPEFAKTDWYSWPEFLNCSEVEVFPDSSIDTLGCFAPPEPRTLTVPTISGLLNPVPQTAVYIQPSSTMVYSSTASVSGTMPSSLSVPSVKPTPSSSACRKLSPMMSGWPILTLAILTLLCTSV